MRTDVDSRRTVARRVLTIVACVLVAAGALVVAPVGAPQSSARFLQVLERLNDQESSAFLDAHPGRGLDLLNALPEQAAREWPLIPAAGRRELERSLPALVGNLDGIPYAVRDAANRRTLARELRSAEHAARTRKNDQAAQTRLTAYAAIRAALFAKASPPRQLIELVPGAQPTAAISIGVLDTAQMVTWTVPGMGTYTTDMQLWTLAAQNIWQAQYAAAAPSGHAVIAWIGYATPPVGLDAALGDYAANGAPKLTDAIRGLTALRHADPPIVNVVAHSYGTTMAADALADTNLGIAAFVMLGSAGVEDRIASAADLHVHDVYAGEAVADTEAVLGRTSRTDPRSPAFGAQLLPVDGDPDAHLLPVTQHAPILHSAYNDDITSGAWTGVPAATRAAAFRAHLSQHGYLDVGTQSLREVGVATATAEPPAVEPRRSPAADGPRGSGIVTLRLQPPGDPGE